MATVFKVRPRFLIRLFLSLVLSFFPGIFVYRPWFKFPVSSILVVYFFIYFLLSPLSVAHNWAGMVQSI